MTSLFWNAFWRNTLVCVTLGLILWALPDRPTDPEAVRQNSGNTVFYDHRHECWTGIRPSWAPEVPGHVVMRIEDGLKANGNWFYGGKRYVAIALNDVFTKDNPRVFVYAFCD